MIRLIGLDGEKGTGKDTIAEVLITRYGFTKLAFAKNLKDMISEVFKLAPELLEDATLKDVPIPAVTMSVHEINGILDWLELKGTKVTPQMIRHCLALAGQTFNTPRALMQYVGTDLVRTHIGSETWVNLWAKDQASYGKVVAPDARFQNERDAIKVRSGKIVLIKRPNLTKTDTHISENSVTNDSEYDAVVHNIVSKGQIQSEFGLWYGCIRDKIL